MATVQELMKLGEQMNLTGTDLKEFIREQQILAREEREREREREIYARALSVTESG